MDSGFVNLHVVIVISFKICLKQEGILKHWTLWENNKNMNIILFIYFSFINLVCLKISSNITIWRFLWERLCFQRIFVGLSVWLKVFYLWTWYHKIHRNTNPWNKFGTLNFSVMGSVVNTQIATPPIHSFCEQERL